VTPKPPQKPPRGSEDLGRVALLQVLRELNKSAQAATHPEDNGLELREIMDRLTESQAGRAGAMRVPVILGTLVQNGMVDYVGTKVYSWVRQRDVRDRYVITTQGKEFLRLNVETNDRIT
jgi:hypothetical protein